MPYKNISVAILSLILIYPLFLLNKAFATEATDIIHVEKPWMRAIPGNEGAIYMILHNHGPDDKIIAVTSEEATMAHLHVTLEKNSISHMETVMTLPLLPGKTIFAPNGMHIMVLGLKKNLKNGQTFPLTLMFEHHPPIKIAVPIIDPLSSQ
jgi:copper(I)-binding protein